MIVFLIGCVLLLSLWVILLSRKLSLSRAQIKMQEERHRQEYADFIAKVNHEGPVPLGSTAVGLMRVILLGIDRSSKKLIDLYAIKDWNTSSVIQDLLDMKSQELVMLHNQFVLFLEAIRKVLKDHNHKQE